MSGVESTGSGADSTAPTRQERGSSEDQSSARAWDLVHGVDKFGGDHRREQEGGEVPDDRQDHLPHVREPRRVALILGGVSAPTFGMVK